MTPPTADPSLWQFFLLYPERKTVDGNKILGWFADAVANKEVDYDGDPSEVNPDEAARLLEDAGLITVGRV